MSPALSSAGSSPTSSSGRGTRSRAGPRSPTIPPPWSRRGRGRSGSSPAGSSPSSRTSGRATLPTKAADAPKLAVVLKDYSAAPYSVLEAAKDPGANLIWLGCLLVSVGFFLAFYWPPREIRVVLEESQGKVDLAAGGQASKSREAFQAEFDGIFESIRRPE